MKTYLAIVLIGLSGLTLAACDSSVEERASYQRNFDAGLLPAGEGTLTPDPSRR